MNKNKGFTVIETIVSFCLISVVSIMVLQIILSVRDLYIIGDVKTTMLVKQGIMVQKIQDDATKKGINRIDECDVQDNNCKKIIFNDGSSTTLEKTDEYIYYNNYKYNLLNGSTASDITIESHESSDGKLFKISIPITHKLLEDDIGVYVVAQQLNV